MTQAATIVSADKSPASARGAGWAVPDVNSAVWLFALIGLIACIHVSMVLGRSINGDEFWFYSQVEIVARGDAIQPLQTIHTRAFAWWLPALPGNAIDHIQIARIVMLMFIGVAGFGVYSAARAFGDHRAALLAAAAYLGAGYVLHHGTSFRVDPIVTALLANALAIALRTSLSARWIVALGVLVGLAAMVTIKFVLWAPAFAGAALWRWHALGYDWRYIARWFAAGAVALATFAALFALHGMAAGLPDASGSATGTLTQSAEAMFRLNGRIHMLILGVAAANSLPLALMAFGVVVFVLRQKDWPGARKLAVLGLWAVTLTPIYYSNSVPYAYVFFLAPVAVTTALVAPIFAQRYSYAGIAGAVAVCAIAVWAVDRRDMLAEQHKMVDAVHLAFPQPVAYFDCCGMIGSFEKANDFRSVWGVKRYLAAGEPEFLKQLKARPVPLAIDNNDDFSPLFDGTGTDEILPADAAALRGNFIHFWGDIYLAGAELGPLAKRKWALLVPGTYTVEGAMIVNGKRLGNGALVTLTRGTVKLENPRSTASRLVWGKRPQRPNYAPAPSMWVSY